MFGMRRGFCTLVLFIGPSIIRIERVRTRFVYRLDLDMAEKAAPSLSLLPHRWSRDEIPLSRREGEVLLAQRVGRRPRPPSPRPEVTNE